MEERKREIFNEIESQINKMDNKAGILISAVGIVFALTIDLLSIFSKSEVSIYYKMFSYIFLGIYLLSFLVSMSFFILTIIPRKKKGYDDEKVNINYYYDLSDIQCENIDDEVKRNQVFDNELEEEAKTDHVLTNQIFINAEICRRKHDTLFYGIITLIPFVLSMIGLIVLFVIG